MHGLAVGILQRELRRGFAVRDRLNRGGRPGGARIRGTARENTRGDKRGGKNGEEARCGHRLVSPDSIISTKSGSSELPRTRSEEHTSELQSLRHLVCRLLLA